MSNKKQEILLAALRLFSKNGYEAVSVSDIAGELSLTKGALYRHFKSKRDIFDSIILRMEQEDELRAREYGMPEGTPEQTAKAYADASYGNIKAYTVAQFRYWTEDEFASAFRKMLTLEQYRSPEMARLYVMYLSCGPLDYMEDLFFEMTSDRDKSEKLAVGFYAPMFLLYNIYDHTQDKKSVLCALTEHIEDFGVKNGLN